MGRRQPSGMGTKRGPVAHRPPIGTQTCRGCNAEVTDETSRWDDERRTFVCTACGISDPCGLFGPTHPDPCGGGEEG